MVYIQRIRSSWKSTHQGPNVLGASISSAAVAGTMADAMIDGMVDGMVDAMVGAMVEELRK